MDLFLLSPSLLTEDSCREANQGNTVELPDELFFSDLHGHSEPLLLVHICRGIPSFIVLVDSCREVAGEIILCLPSKLLHSIVNGIYFQDEGLIKLVIDLLELILRVLNTPYILQDVPDHFLPIVLVDESSTAQLNVYMAAFTFFLLLFLSLFLCNAVILEAVIEGLLVVVEPELLSIEDTSHITK